MISFGLSFASFRRHCRSGGGGGTRTRAERLLSSTVPLSYYSMQRWIVRQFSGAVLRQARSDMESSFSLRNIAEEGLGGLGARSFQSWHVLRH